MTSNERFNNLHGVRSNRNELLSIIDQAKSENNISVIYRLESILQANPDAKTFLLEIEQFPSTGLSAPRHTGSYKEALDECGRLRKGFKFEKGSVVKVEPKKKGNAQKTKKPTDKVAKVVDKSKKITKPTSVKKAAKTIRIGKASNYGKKTKRTKKAVEPIKETKFDFIYEVGYQGKFIIKSFIDFPIIQGLKNEGKTSTVSELISYTATNKAFEKLQKLFPNHAYGDRHNLSSKDLNRAEKIEQKEDNNTYSIRKNSAEYKEVIDWKVFTMYSLDTDFRGILITKGLSDFDKKNAKITKRNDVYTLHIHSNLWYEAVKFDKQRSGKASDYGKKTKRVKKAVETNKYPFSKDDISLELARRAHSGTSHVPEKRAISEQNNYFETLKSIYDKYLEISEKKDLKDKFINLFNRFYLKYKDLKINELQARSRVLSTNITGPANFPTARNKKNSGYYENKQKETWDHIEKYEKYFNILLYPEKQPIKTGKIGTLTKLEEKLASLERSQVRMNKANAEIRRLVKKGLSTENVISEYEKYLSDNGYSSEEVTKITSLAKRENRLMWLPFGTTNSGAEIRRIKARIETEKKLKVKAAEKGDSDKFYFSDGFIFYDYNDNRIKITFDGKPSEEIRTFLKKSGQNFKWSPFNKVWQRQLNTYYRGSKDELFKFLEVSNELEKKNETLKKPLEANPVPFSKKPKSSSVQTAINNVLSLPKFKGIKELPASLLFKNFKEEQFLLEPKELYLTEYEKAILSKESKLHSYYEYQQWHQEIELTSLGEDFILAVRGRLESLRNQKHNYALFDGLAGPTENVIVNPVAPGSTMPILQVQENHIENWLPIEESKQVPAQEEKPKNLSSGAKRLLGTNFDTLAINEEWSELMQNPAANLKIAIWGKPKNGKTSASLQMAEYFTNFGKVLYNFADQGFNLSTQELWKDSGLANNSNAEPSDISTTQELEAEIATGQYKFVFIDMISDYIRKEKLKPEEFKERFIKRFPDVSFILIFEVTKSGDFKGDQGWTHVVDAIMTVENFFMENRGRYGMGERIIWEESFQRFNPKRYEEFIREKRELEAGNAPVETVIN